MNRNITFTADEALIEAAREAARSENTTLNQQVRLWLESYVRERQADKVMEACGTHIQSPCQLTSISALPPSRLGFEERTLRG